MQAQLRASHISFSLAMKFQGTCSLRYLHWFGGCLIVEPLWVDSFLVLCRLAAWYDRNIP
jgi:hypothetical protein